MMPVRFLLLAVLCGQLCSPQSLDPEKLRTVAGRSAVSIAVVDHRSGQLTGCWNCRDPRFSANLGSAIKPFVLAALLLAGHPVSVSCSRNLWIAGRNFTCSHPDAAGPLGPAEALALSCNSYFAAAARWLDPTALARFGVEIPPSSDIRLIALGEAGPRMTAAGLAFAYRRLLQIHDPRLKPVWEGMRGAVEYGTAQNAAVTGASVAGKTGTPRDGAWFAGYFPAESPRSIVAVFARSGTGGTSAAPVASRVFALLQ